MLLLPLGPLAERNVRATFAANLLASGGIEAVNPGTVDAAGVADAVARRRRGGGHLRHRRPLRQRRRGVVAAARAAGVEEVLLAGPEKAVADAPAESRPDGYLTAKIDAVEALSSLLARLGA